jgi:hypothetical protein
MLSATRSQVAEQVGGRIDRCAEVADLEVQVGTGRVAGRSDVADRHPAGDPLTDRGRDSGHVRVPALEAEPVLHHDQVAVAARVEPGEGDDADAASVNGRPLRLGEVEAGVPTARGDPTEAVADRPRDGTEEAHRADGPGGHDLGPPEGVQRRWPGDAVDPQVCGGLEAPHRVLRVGPEPPVEAPRLEAALVEEELERRDVPAPLAPAHGPRPEVRLAALAERRARPRSRDPVHGEPVLCLERADRLLGPRPSDPVDRMRVEAERPHRHLERRYVGAARAGRSRNG